MRKEKGRKDGKSQEERIFCTEKMVLASWTGKMDLICAVGQLAIYRK